MSRKEAMMIAERERRLKYKKQEEQRETVRQNIRDKVAKSFSAWISKYFWLYSTILPNPRRSLRVRMRMTRTTRLVRPPGGKRRSAGLRIQWHVSWHLDIFTVVYFWILATWKSPRFVKSKRLLTQFYHSSCKVGHFLHIIQMDAKYHNSIFPFTQ